MCVEFQTSASCSLTIGEYVYNLYKATKTCRERLGTTEVKNYFFGVLETGSAPLTRRVERREYKEGGSVWAFSVQCSLLLFAQRTSPCPKALGGLSRSHRHATALLVQRARFRCSRMLLSIPGRVES